jgi:hypothetical protein
MTTLTSVARVEAYALGRAVPIATRRHLQVSDRPLVFVPLGMAGEANAPLACLVGDTPASPTLLVVPQPRNRDLRFAFAAQLADVVLSYVDSFTTAMDLVKDKAVFTDAPQLVVANPAAVEFTRLLGRSTRFRRADGPYPVDPAVPLLGRWLTWFADATERPGSSVTIALTDALAQIWATGQSALEDANLAALMGWIEPWDGLTGQQAAAQAEDPALWPPAGPATDPDFDERVLAGLIKSYDLASDGDERTRAEATIAAALRSQLEPTWRLMWRAVELLRSVEPASTVERRWLRDRQTFTTQVEYWRDGGAPQPRVDHAVRAAQRLAWLERDLDEFTVERALDDPLAMAEYRLSGEAFVGRVISVDATRVDTSGKRRKPRPLVVLATRDPVRLEPGTTVRSAARPGQDCRVISVAPLPAAPAEPANGAAPDVFVPMAVTLELVSGMGRALTPAPGSVPEVDDELCYSALVTNAGVQPKFPSREETPWTHGGPPVSPEVDLPTVDDAVEDWS